MRILEQDTSAYKCMSAGLSCRKHEHKSTCQRALLHRLSPPLPCREVDLCMSELASAVPVDVMPGHSDPANHSLPQQPLHGCLLPGAAGYTTFNRWASLLARLLF